MMGTDRAAVEGEVARLDALVVGEKKALEDAKLAAI
jgi:hypothetical protein